MKYKIRNFEEGYVDPSEPNNIFLLNNKENLSLDIGCGEGEFIIELGKRNPNKFYLGIDIKYGRILKGLKKLNKDNVRNVKFMNFNVSFLTNKIFFSKNINEIYINNPDPWPKDKHSKNRILTKEFLDTLFSIIKKKGEININTDSKEYLDFIKNQISNSKFKEYKENVNQNLPVTKFQNYYSSINKEIHSIKIIKS